MKGLRETLVATLAFSIVGALYELYIFHAQVSSLPAINYVAKFLMSVGLFSLVFQITLGFCYKLFIYAGSKEKKLSGPWHHVHIVKNNSNGVLEERDIRFGPVSVDMTSSNSTISADTSRLDIPGTYVSWTSENIFIAGNTIWILYHSTVGGRGRTFGIIELTLNETNPEVLKGNFHDSNPADHFGIIEFYRDKASMEKRVEEIRSTTGERYSGAE